MIFGRTLGLKPAELKALEHLEKRRVAPEQLCSVPLARSLVELSARINRRVGVLIDRRGRVRRVAVGDATRIWVPEFGRVRAGKGRLRGLRWVITYLRDQAFTQDDYTDLIRLRFDATVSIGVQRAGEPGTVQIGRVAPYADGEPLYTLEDPCTIHELDLDFMSWISDWERVLASAAPPTLTRTSGGPRTLLAFVDLPDGPPVKASLRELEELCRTAGLSVVAQEVQRRKKPDHRYVFGSGRLQELMFHALQLDVEMIVFGCSLSAAQMREISAVTELKVIDRTQLILDIFAQHAKTREGKLQVELAQLQYLLPRLAGRHSALSRLAGGIGGRGPGETKLEIDRRRVKDRINLLEKKIDGLAKQRDLQRQRRRRSEIPIVGIVGYTNAGKSTLLNALTGSEVIAEDKLFATLDPTTRRLRFPEEREIILADTVGFIRDLPPELMRAFRATLEELSQAHLLLHVVDISDPGAEEHMEAVVKTLCALGIQETPVQLILNKCDQAHNEDLAKMLQSRQGALLISALKTKTLRALVRSIGARLFNQAGPEDEPLPSVLEHYSKTRETKWSPI